MRNNIAILTDLAKLLEEYRLTLYNSGFLSHAELMTNVENSASFRLMRTKYNLPAETIHDIITIGRYADSMEKALQEIAELMQQA